MHIDFNLAHLAGAIPYMLVLGIIMSFSPSTYGITIHTLVKDKDAFFAVRWIAIGVAAASTLLIIIFTPLNPTELIETFKGSVSKILLQQWVDRIAGILLVVSSWFIWRSRHTKRAPKKQPKDMVRELSARKAFLLGFANTLAGTSGIATMYVTGRVLEGVSDSYLIKIPVYCVFLLGLLGPYIAVLYYWNRSPRVADDLTRGFDKIAGLNFRPLLAIAIFISGLVFLWLGFR